MRLQSFLFFIASLLLITSCSKEDDNSLKNVKGKYVLEAFSSTGCKDANQNLTLSPKDGKLCATVNGADACIDVCMEFTETMYKVTFTTSIAGTSFSQSDEGAFDRNNEKGELCVKGDCNVVKVTNGGKNIEVSYKDEDDGCTVTMRMKRQ